jgi:hypothetical protein
MHNRTLLTALATAAAVAIATPSLSRAQTPTPTPPTPQVSKGEVATQPTYSSLMTAISATSAQNAKLKALTTVNASDVQLVNVQTLLKDNADSLTAAIKANESDIATLRTTLGANTAISGVLSANTVPLTTADVVAADVGADGKVVLYYWKKSE